MNFSAIKNRARSMFQSNYWLSVAIFAILSAMSGVSSGMSSMGSGVTNLSKIGDSFDGFSGMGSAMPAFSAGFVILSLLISSAAIAAAIFIVGPFIVSNAKASLNIYDGQRPNFKDVIFCFREGRYFKCVGTMALVILFVILAVMVVMIPLIIVIAVLAVLMGSYNVDLNTGMPLFILFAVLAAVGAYVPCVIVSLGLSQTQYIAADEGIYGMAAVKRSWELMRGHKWNYFVFGLSFFGWIMLTVLTFGVVGVFFVNPYMAVSMGGYYRELTGTGEMPVEAEAV